MKNGKKRWMHWFVAAGAFFLALECTCAPAFSADPAPAPVSSASSMPGCHKAGGEVPPKEAEPGNCCGKCQAGHDAVLRASDPQTISPVSGHHVSGPQALLSDGSAPVLSSADGVPLDDPGGFSPDLLSLSPALPRAPPAV